MIADGFKRWSWTNVALAERPDLRSRSIRTRIRLRELSVDPSPQQFPLVGGSRFLPSVCGPADRTVAGASDGDINTGLAATASNSMVQDNQRPKQFGNLPTAVGVSRNSGDAVKRRSLSRDRGRVRYCHILEIARVVERRRGRSPSKRKKGEHNHV